MGVWKIMDTLLIELIDEELDLVVGGTPTGLVGEGNLTALSNGNAANHPDGTSGNVNGNGNLVGQGNLTAGK